MLFEYFTRWEQLEIGWARRQFPVRDKPGLACTSTDVASFPTISTNSADKFGGGGGSTEVQPPPRESSASDSARLARRLLGTS